MSRYLSCLRLREILVLQGPPLLGAAFALRHPSVGHLEPLAVLVSANLFLVAHIFVLNDWSNITDDSADRNKAAFVFTGRGVNRGQMGRFAAFLLTAGLLILSLLGPTTLSIAAGIAILSGLYSLPLFNWKGRPIVSSVTHLTGGVLHFLLGYSLGGVFDSRGFLASAFFGVTFAAGHLTQEVRDHEGDLRNTVGTHAVIFGPRRAFAASLALFTVSHGLVLLMALEGILVRALVGLVVLYPIQIRWSFLALAGGLTHESVSRLQQRYRVLYAVIGLAMVASLSLG